MHGYEAVRHARRARQPDGKPIPAGTARVLEVLADHIGENNGLLVWPGEETIAEAIGRARRTVRGHLALLAGWGLIERQHRYKREGTRGGREHDVICLKFLEGYRQPSAANSQGLPADSDRVTGRPLRGYRQTSDGYRQYARPEETIEGIKEAPHKGTNSLPVEFQENDNSNNGWVGGEVGVDANGNGHPANATEGRQPPLLAAVSPEPPPEPPTADQLAEIERLSRERGIEEEIPVETKQDAAGVIAALESATSSTAIQRVRLMARSMGQRQEVAA